LALTGVAFGQRNTAAVSGIITDPTGAAVPDAQVTALQTSTGTAIKTQSNLNGFYLLPNVPAGSYTLRVERIGFQVYIQEGIVLQVDQSATVNVSLKVGSQAESVTVTGEPPLVDARTQTLTTVITPEMARELPLNGRNVLQLMALSPDVSPGGTRCFAQGAARPEARVQFVAASGARSNETAFYMDGGINEDPYTSVANIFPNPDAIQEFSFQTNNYSAKFGGRGGGVVNAATRSGANDFHGSAFEFVRNYTFNAKNFFASTDDGQKRNQYGFSLGGPVQKNKTFFFLSWQGTNLRQRPSQNVAVTATAAERNGDFSAVSAKLVDPTTNMPFPNKQVPVTSFDPIAMKVLSYVPTGAPGSGLAYYTSRTINDDSQWVGRIDHNFSEKLRLFGRYVYDRLDKPSSYVKGNFLTVGSDSYWKSQNMILNLSYVARPNLVGYVTATFNRAVIVSLGPQDFPGWSDLGVKVVNASSKGNSLGLNVSDYFSNNWDPIYRIPRNQYNLNTNWTWIKGTHTVEFGGEAIRDQNILQQDFLTGGNITFGAGISGDNLLDFMLGKPSDFEQISATYEDMYRTFPAMYVTDAWKVTRRLTLNYGVRWAPWEPFDEKEGQTTVFDPALYAKGVRSTKYPKLPPGLLIPGDPGVPRRGVPRHWAIFDPRLGFAWDLFGDGRTSIRAGYGIYHDMLVANSNNSQLSTPPWALSEEIPFPYSLADPYRGRVNPFPAFRPFPSTMDFASPFIGNAYDPAMDYPRIQQWNFTIERQLPKQFMVRAAYEGMDSQHLFGGVEANMGVYIPGRSTFDNTQDRRPMGQYFTSMSVNKATGIANFHALALTAEKRATRGLTFLAGFRWAKMMDEMNGGGTTLGQSDYTTTDPRFDYALSSVDVNKQLIVSYVWEVPTPKSLPALARYIVGGWRSSGIVTLRGGFPFSVRSGRDYSYSGNGLDRADLVGNPFLPSDRPKQEKLYQWFDPKAFSYNAPGTFGNSGRDILRAPGTENVDFSMIKSFPLRLGPLAERQRIEFRAEFFNLFNRANFNAPTSRVSSSLNGRILSAKDPRILQFAVRYSF
jgi:hypothetical protein